MYLIHNTRLNNALTYILCQLAVAAPEVAEDTTRTNRSQKRLLKLHCVAVLSKVVHDSQRALYKNNHRNTSVLSSFDLRQTRQMRESGTPKN